MAQAKAKLTLSPTKRQNHKVPGHATLIYPGDDDTKALWEQELQRLCKAFGLGTKSDLLKALVIVASRHEDTVKGWVEEVKTEA